MYNKIFYDTCSLLELQEKAFEDFFYISDVTLYELENIKSSGSKDNETKYKARHLLHLLEENENKFSVVLSNNSVLNNDKAIIDCANSLVKRGVNVTFKTKDLACREIAKYTCPKLKVDKVSEQEDEYTGYKIVNMTDDELADFYTSPKNIFDLYENQYLLIQQNGVIIDEYKFKNNTFEKVNHQKIDSKFFGKVAPFKGDKYQLLAIDSLASEQMTVLRGPAGTGKSYLAFAYMMHELETGKRDKIIIFCNTVAAKGAAKLGFYPGTKDEKLLDSQIGNFLTSKLGRETVERMIDEEKLVLLPLADIRGYDTSNSNAVIYITEAQNLDIDLMKLALQRIGEDCKVILDGDDTAQVDLDMYAGGNNGLRRVSKIFRGKDLYSEVTLKNIYRSKIAKIAEEM